MHVKDNDLCIPLAGFLEKGMLSDEVAEAVIDFLIFDPRFINRMVDAILGLNGDDSVELQDARHRFMRKFDEMAYWEAKEGRRIQRNLQEIRELFRKGYFECDEHRKALQQDNVFLRSQLAKVKQAVGWKG